MYKEFRATESVDECIARDDRMGLIGTLTGICYLDKTFSTRKFDDGLEYVTKAKGYTQLWQPLQTPPTLYGDRVDAQDPLLSADDFAYAVSHLQRNFCQERIDDLKKLGRHLFSPSKAAPKNQLPEQATPQVRSKASAGIGDRREAPSPFALVAIVAALIAVASFALWILKR